jgi:hypothetical protein
VPGSLDVHSAQVSAVTSEQVDAGGAFDRLVEAARDKTRVTGLTHTFYRYPARFSPKFVRRVIEQFTEPGDLVFDPFMGGGTTLVEALFAGRHAVGTDISSLATFVSKAKTTVFSKAEFGVLDKWVSVVADQINMRAPSNASVEYQAAGYYKHLGTLGTWRLRKSIEQVLAAAGQLPNQRLEAFARCVVLRTAQWALDGRKQLPTIVTFRKMLRAFANEMLAGARDLSDAVDAHGTIAPVATCFNKSVIGMEIDNPCAGLPPKLVLTSPPYPGVHVLYHRWQVEGRKETAAPFWIANALDGSGAAYYTLGDRHTADNWTYFEGLQAALNSVARICDHATTIVQVVAFSNPKRQLPRYLEVAAAAGLAEIITPHLHGNEDGRLWRIIPNRKWHARMLGNIPASQEVVLFHKKSL